MVSDPIEPSRRYQREAEGLVLPVPVTDDPALDFCNTLAGWNADEPRDYLASYDHLVVWTREAGLVDGPTAAGLRAIAGVDSQAAHRELRRARSLRQALYAACTAPEDVGAWGEVGRQARAAAAHAVLLHDAPPGHRWSIADTSLARPVLELARCAGALLATVDLDRVKSCPGTGCGWLFLDRRGHRRWCSMEVCGNRAKARRHAERARRGARHDER